MFAPPTLGAGFKFAPVLDGLVGPVRSLAMAVRLSGGTVVTVPKLPPVAPTAAGLQGRDDVSAWPVVEGPIGSVPDTPGPVGAPWVGCVPLGGLSVLLAPPVAPVGGAGLLGAAVLAPPVVPLGVPLDCASARGALAISSQAPPIMRGVVIMARHPF